VSHDAAGNPHAPPVGVCDGAALGLQPGEVGLARFEPDLDHRLHFRRAWVCLTDQRLLFEDPAAPGGEWRSLPLESLKSVSVRESGGVGALEVAGPEGRPAHWYYTAGQSSAAQGFAQRANIAIRARAAGAKDGDADQPSICPSCGALLEAGQVVCPHCVAPSQPPPARSLWRLARFARPQAKLAALGFLLMVATTGASLVPPYLTMPLMDDVLVPHQTTGDPVDYALAAFYLGGLALAAFFAWLLGWARTYVVSVVSERVAADLRHQTYAHLQTLSLEFFGGKRTGDLISRVGSDTDRICHFLSVQLLDFLTDLLMIVMTSVILFSINPLLALITLAPFPLIVVLVERVRQRLRHGFERGSRAWAALLSVLADTIPGIRVVKAFTQEQREIERFGRANQHVVDANTRVNRLWSFFGPTVAFLTEIGLMVVWGFGVWLVAEDNITVGVLSAFIAYIGRFYVRLEAMSRMVGSTQRAAASTHRLFEILDRASSVPEPVAPVAMKSFQGGIEMRNVSFRYGRRRVMHGIDLKIRPGEMIGLVGHTGAGKTTLVNLICRFFDVAEGAILIDGVDIRSLPVEQYRRNIGIVLQEPFLFFGTIAENIAYARPQATRDEIIAAARAACAHDFILRLPDGYDSLVGERGQSLSGGERQRISIARALLTDPRILILDEATSSVDTETEREIQKALANLIRGRTTLAIAHRLSTLRRADRLVVLDQGKIVEVGSHDDLLGRGGAYARLYQAQLEMAQENLTI